MSQLVASHGHRLFPGWERRMLVVMLRLAAEGIRWVKVPAVLFWGWKVVE